MGISGPKWPICMGALRGSYGALGDGGGPWGLKCHKGQGIWDPRNIDHFLQVWAIWG